MGNSSSAAPSIATLSTTEFDEEFESFIRYAKQLLSPDVFGKVEGWLRGLKDDIDPSNPRHLKYFRYLSETPGGDEEWCETTTVDDVENNVTWVIENIEDEDE